MWRNRHVTRIQKIPAALFLSNSPRSFHNICFYETGLYDFYKLVVTILRASFELLPPKAIECRKCKNFDEDKFRCLFKKRLNDFNTEDITVDIFKMTFLNGLSKFTPLRRNVRELITPVLLAKNLMRQSCNDQSFVMIILKIKLEQLG